MKKIHVTFIFFVLFSFLNAQNIHSITIGSSMPLADTKMKDISGKEISISSAAKKNGTLVMFSCNTCPYVLRNQTRTKAIAAYAKQNNIGIILINANEADRSNEESFGAMVSYAKKQSYDFYYSVDVDSKIANAFGATRTPEVFLFDENGILQYKGAIDDNPADAGKVKRIHLQEAIMEMIAGKPISIKETRSLGCAIKRN